MLLTEEEILPFPEGGVMSAIQLKLRYYQKRLVSSSYHPRTAPPVKRFPCTYHDETGRLKKDCVSNDQSLPYRRSAPPPGKLRQREGTSPVARHRLSRSQATASLAILSF